jgi:hypothetical protein
LNNAHSIHESMYSILNQISQFCAKVSYILGLYKVVLFSFSMHGHYAILVKHTQSYCALNDSLNF